MTLLSTELLALLAETARDFIAEHCSSLDTNINRTLASIGRLFDADRAYVFEVCKDRGLVRNTHEWCAAGVEPQIANLQDLPADLFPWWMRELRAGRAIHLSSLDDLPPEGESMREMLEAQHIHSLLVLPLERRGQLDGFAGFDHVRGSRRWSDEEVAVLRIVVSSFAQGFERRLIDQRLEQMAYEDSLTGLPNRALLGQRLEEALAAARQSGRLLAVGYLDLDAFKLINDSYGHAVGDELLALMAARLRRSMHPGDTVARLGGDEFVVVLPDLESREQLLARAEALLALIAEPCTIGEGYRVAVSTSLGLRLVPPDDAGPDLLLRQADQAMYAAKRAGRSRIHLFDPSFEQREHQRHARIRAIRSAISGGELRLFVQPMIDLATGRVASLEALVRWASADQGLLLPGEWLPLIEDDPAILSLGEWVMEQALHWGSQWLKAGLCAGISVNVSARELLDPGFAARLRARLGSHPQLPPGALRLEVLESAALRDLEQVKVTMQACCEAGVSFALDDFGTGYSSLSYLRQLPVSVIKIDRSFVQQMLTEPSDGLIVRGVIDLAHAFGLHCVAEGVESLSHRHMLQAMGCEFAQGFAIARPMPAEAFQAWVKADAGGSAGDACS
ncbi:MAG: EAL domain-containing protein [Cyanobacteria bacterium M_surface_10_m2_119]|nr:EAL domain-containing protein [Cyanobacteria bacterium M_surface_10_m2_119]